MSDKGQDYLHIFLIVLCESQSCSKFISMLIRVMK